MGNCNYKIENIEQSQSNPFNYYNQLDITKNHFKFHCVVGKGGFGKVIRLYL